MRVLRKPEDRGSEEPEPAGSVSGVGSPRAGVAADAVLSLVSTLQDLSEMKGYRCNHLAHRGDP